VSNKKTRSHDESIQLLPNFAIATRSPAPNHSLRPEGNPVLETLSLGPVQLAEPGRFSSVEKYVW
jgi:hypothetical protein